MIKYVESGYIHLIYDIYELSKHPFFINRIDLYKRMGNVDMSYLLENTNPKIIEKLSTEYSFEFNELIVKYSYRKILSRNPGAIDFLEKNKHYIQYEELCKNPHPKAIEWFEKEHITKIFDLYLFDSPGLSLNEEAFYLFDKYPYLKLCADFKLLSMNPAIIKLNYKSIQQLFLKEGRLGKELTEWIWNPKNMHKWGENNWSIMENEDIM
jgi:hypothetical protein